MGVISLARQQPALTLGGLHSYGQRAVIPQLRSSHASIGTVACTALSL